MNDVMSAAARQLAMRPLTEKQLREKLLEKEFSEPDIETAVAKMLELGALDDAAYAADFVESRSARGQGAFRIRQELKQRGIDEDTIAEALESLDDPTDTILQIILQKTRGAAPDRDAKRKISASLMRKGFTWEQIRTAFERITDEYGE